MWRNIRFIHDISPHDRCKEICFVWMYTVLLLFTRFCVQENGPKIVYGEKNYKYEFCTCYASSDRIDQFHPSRRGEGAQPLLKSYHISHKGHFCVEEIEPKFVYVKKITGNFLLYTLGTFDN